MILPAQIAVQVPLIHLVESDDRYLEEQDEILWFHELRDYDWVAALPVACQYYEALWQFNQAQAGGRMPRMLPNPVLPFETQEEADRRLLLQRATLSRSAPVLAEPLASELDLLHVDPASIRPGVVPPRLAGRQPKCFFAMAKAFLGVMLRGRKGEPEEVHQELAGNPAFARTCGFTLPDRELGYRQSDLPGLRKLQQFDQIMTAHVLWGQLGLDKVARNLKEGRVRAENTLVHDTTHYPAWSTRTAVEAVDEAGKPVRKSQAKSTKPCRCRERETCPHPWISADPGAGTVVKTGGKMHWAHKASTLSFAGQEVLLDAVALTDAACHDSRSLVPHLARVFQRHPELAKIVTRVLDDGAADDAGLKASVCEEFQVQLLASQNPRGRKALRDDLPRGIDHVTPTGTPICLAGYPFDFQGCRWDTERFLFRAPTEPDGTPVCQACSRREACCRKGCTHRHVSLPFERLHWIDPYLPQLSRRFQKLMARRTVIERLHKLMKYDFGDERLSKRGTVAFQARLDKTLWAMHVALAGG